MLGETQARLTATLQNAVSNAASAAELMSDEEYLLSHGCLFPNGFRPVSPMRLEPIEMRLLRGLYSISEFCCLIVCVELVLHEVPLFM